uniref:Uncharacterized protein n=1 Tax=Schistocephalus solidus TaxID=70667 RepID=A0A0X3QD88_SCHSO
MLTFASALCFFVGCVLCCWTTDESHIVDLSWELEDDLEGYVKKIKTLTGFSGRHFLRISELSVGTVKYCMYREDAEYLNYTFLLVCDLTFRSIQLDIFSNVDFVDAYTIPTKSIYARHYKADVIVSVYHPTFKIKKITFPYSFKGSFPRLVENVKQREFPSEIKRLFEYMFNDNETFFRESHIIFN